MNGLSRLLAVLLPLGVAGNGPASEPQDPVLPSGPADPAVADPALQGTMMTFNDLETRLTVPVAVGKKGPYPFIIDTGSERTVVSRELAGVLGLAAGNPINLTSMTGRSRVNTVIVPGLAIESIGVEHTITAPALERRNLGAVGLLGIDTLAKHKVSIDFETGIMTVHPSERRLQPRSRDENEIVVTARSRFGQLIVTDAYYDNIKIQVVLDTGAQVSMGNSALRKRVARKLKGMQSIELTSVTGEKAQADYTMVPGIKVGNVKFDWLPVAFADVAPFERFELQKRPALLLGMDAMRSFRRIDIDFANRQVRFLLPKPGKASPI